MRIVWFPPLFHSLFFSSFLQYFTLCYSSIVFILDVKDTVPTSTFPSLFFCLILKPVSDMPTFCYRVHRNKTKSQLLVFRDLLQPQNELTRSKLARSSNFDSCCCSPTSVVDLRFESSSIFRSFVRSSDFGNFRYRFGKHVDAHQVRNR